MRSERGVAVGGKKSRIVSADVIKGAEKNFPRGEQIRSGTGVERLSCVKF